MDRDQRHALAAGYRRALLEDTLPFWIRHAVDREHGGFSFCLDRDGSLVDSDKGMWQQGRFTWLLATLYHELEPREEWKELARHGVDFLRRHGFDADGRMHFCVTREGRPLRKRRYVFTESFAAIAFAAWARISGEEWAADEARRLFRLFLRYHQEPGLIPSKVDPDTRPMRSLGFPMIALGTAQVLRDCLGDSEADAWTLRAIEEITGYFVKRDLEVVLETVGEDGEVLDHFDGRLLNPGHAIEAAWFILREAEHRGDPALVALGTDILDWMWRRGWDEEYGGLYYYRDLRGLPVQEYWHDMKFWWPHNEAVIATLLAHLATGEERYARWHGQVHDWAHEHFADPEHGEWFGYLHRDGRLSVPLKGNLWKGPFHLPRMQLVCALALERAAART